MPARNRSIVWGILLILFGAASLIEVYTTLSPWAWVTLLAVGGAAVLVAYLMDRSQRTLLIPAYALWAVAGMVALITLDVLLDESVAVYALVAVALPFVVEYVRNREQWWTLIPAYVLLAVGVMIGLEGIGILDDDLIPAYIMFVIAIPFFIVYLRNRAQWWPLIPGGILAVIGIAFLLAAGGVAKYVAPTALLVIGVWLIVRQITEKEPDHSEIDGPSPE